MRIVQIAVLSCFSFAPAPIGDTKEVGEPLHELHLKACDCIRVGGGRGPPKCRLGAERRPSWGEWGALTRYIGGLGYERSKVLMIAKTEKKGGFYLGNPIKTGFWGTFAS